MAELESVIANNDPLPSASEDVGIEPPLGPRASAVGMVIVTVSLLLAAFTAILPAVALVWWTACSFVEVAAAETLQQSGGLDNQIFESAYWLSLGIDLAVLAWCAVRLVTRPPHPWFPLFLLSVVYSVAFVLIIPLGLQRDPEFPSGATATVILGIGWLWKYVVPLALVLCVGRLVVALWRYAYRSQRHWRAVSAVLGVVGLSGSYALAGAGLLGSSINDGGAKIEIEPVQAPPGERDKELAGYRVIGMAVGNAPQPSPSVSRFQECTETIARHEEGNQRFIDRLVAMLARRMRVVDAEDAVFMTILKVCERHARERIQDLVRYFAKAVKNRAVSLCKRPWADLADPDDLDRIACDRFRPSTDGVELARALSTLSAEDKQLLEMRVINGDDFDAIGVEIRTSAATARKRYERLLTRLKGRLEPE